MGMFLLAESVGVTLLEPLLAKPPKPLQRLRVGPLASPEKYTARDWAITNILCLYVGFIYMALFWKNLTTCGWSPDAWPWNLQGYPSANDPEWDCRGVKQTFFEYVPIVDDTTGAVSGSALIGWVAMIAGPLGFTCVLLRLARKLPGWGEPPLPEEAESTTQPAKPPPKEARQEV